MDWTPLSLCFAVTIFAAGSPNTWAIAINRNLLEAIRYTESGGDVCAIKDSGRYLGPYLIEQNHYSDAISTNATLTANSDEYEDVWGEGSIEYSEKVLTAYISLYAIENRLGHKPTDEDMARIHRGGPNGWYNSSTLEYWRKVSQVMNSGRLVPRSANTNMCTPECDTRQCCDMDEDGTYKCFCLQTKVNSPREYVKRPCENCSEIAGIDLVFILDSSGSIGTTNFQKIRNFVNTVIDDLEIGPTRSQVGVIVFSSTAFVSFNLTTYSDKETLTSAVNDTVTIPYIGGGTHTEDALYLLIRQGFTGARPKVEGVPRVAIVVTDGMSNEPAKTVVAAQALREVDSITTYAVGIGNANIDELNIIASERNGQNLTRYIKSFDLRELERLQEDLKQQACSASTVVDVETTPIRRQLLQETKAYLELFVPEDGFTVKVELEIGKVAVCGSNSLERPDCSYHLTYDWKLEVSSYAEVFIEPDGFPSGYEVHSPHTTDEPNLGANKTVYVTVEGLEASNIFAFNTTRGDTTSIKVSDTTVIPTPKANSIQDIYIIIATTLAGAVCLLLICICSVCMIYIICSCTKPRKTDSYSYKNLPTANVV